MPVRPATLPPLTSPAEMDQMVSRAGLTLNAGQMADLVLAWRQVVQLLGRIPRNRRMADDQAYVFRLSPPGTTAAVTAPAPATAKKISVPAPVAKPPAVIVKVRKAASKKTASKKPAVKKPAGKKVAGKKLAAKRPATRKAAATRPVAKRSVAGKTAKKSAVRRKAAPKPATRKNKARRR